jgi:hypothetical protein
MKAFRFFSRFALVLCLSFGIASFVFAAVSCSTEGVLRDIIGTSAEAPVFLDCRPVSPTEMVFRFSTPVQVASLFFNPVQTVEIVENGGEVSVTFNKALDA